MPDAMRSVDAAPSQNTGVVQIFRLYASETSEVVGQSQAARRALLTGRSCQRQLGRPTCRNSWWYQRI